VQCTAAFSLLAAQEISLKFVYIPTIQCLFKVAYCVHMVHWSVLMAMKNAHSAINFKNTTHANGNVYDQKNLGKHNFSNAHNV
jgi:hypothetical protein